MVLSIFVGRSIFPGVDLMEGMEENGEMIADLVINDQEYVLCRGGRGGRGNARFANSRDQAPRIAERGEPGRELTIKLELKLIADIGIIGIPNAGKSTLLA